MGVQLQAPKHPPSKDHKARTPRWPPPHPPPPASLCPAPHTHPHPATPKPSHRSPLQLLLLSWEVALQIWAICHNSTSRAVENKVITPSHFWWHTHHTIRNTLFLGKTQAGDQQARNVRNHLLIKLNQQTHRTQAISTTVTLKQSGLRFFWITTEQGTKLKKGCLGFFWADSSLAMWTSTCIL